MLPLSNKPLLVLYSPVDTYSGYGSRGRDLAYSLIKAKEPEFDVRIISCNWGNCSHGALDKDNPKHQIVSERIIPGGQLPKQPEVWIMHSVPNEMQRVGSQFNILITAGVETHIAGVEFIEGCNRADLVLVSSNFTKEVLQRSVFEKINNQTKQRESIVKLERKIDVLFEGVNTDIYKPVESSFELDHIPEDFCFLLTGMWIGGELYHDRKNIATTIKIFLETFKNKKTAPALVLKTTGGSPSIIDREQILDKIDIIRKSVKAHTLPNIYLIYGELTDAEMNAMYNHSKVKAFVLLGNEGFGRPYLEFSISKKPIICSNYSGHTDFLNLEWSYYVGGELRQIHPSMAVKSIIPAEGAWYYPDINEAANAFKNVYEDYDEFLERAKRQGYRSKTEFSLEKMTERISSILNENLPKLSVPITLKLPPLKPRPQKVESHEIN
jgi:glycosyltransferase involved in cell wall biosynthesis